jgi:hypothetical protein
MRAIVVVEGPPPSIEGFRPRLVLPVVAVHQKKGIRI